MKKLFVLVFLICFGFVSGGCDDSSSECNTCSSSYTWVVHYTGAGTGTGGNWGMYAQCCGNNGASDDFYSYFNGDTTTMTCMSCLSGAYSYHYNHGNGYVNGLTCYYGASTCDNNGGSDGAYCLLSQNKRCVSGTGCVACANHFAAYTDHGGCYSSCATNDNDKCETGYICYNGNASCYLSAEGSPCDDEDSDCLSGSYCYDATDTCYDGSLGDSCETSAQCDSGRVCSSNVCADVPVTNIISVNGVSSFASINGIE